MDAFEPLTLGPLTLPNRIVRTATFEGMTPGGRVSDALVAHHAEMARRGVGLGTVAYAAVASEGRTFDDQLLVTEDAGLERVAEAVHAEGAAVSLQLAHAGGFTKRRGARPLGPSAGLNAYGALAGAARIRAMTEADLARTEQAFVDAARIARDAGFDAVELHCGHGYLLSQFLSPLFNRRTDDYGGDVRGRLRLPLRVLRAVVEAVGDDVAVIVKMNLDDGVEGGSSAGDALVIATALEAQGAHALIPSGGLVQRSAFYLLRGAVPIQQMAAAEKGLLDKATMRVFAPLLVKPYAYESAFFFDLAQRLLDAVQIPVGLLGGVDSVDVVERAFARGFGFVVMGRALLADPDFVERMRAGERVVSRCDHCNECIAQMNQGGVRCVL